MTAAPLRYFAYGSNLNAGGLLRWCRSTNRPNALPRRGTPAFLLNAAVVFPQYSIFRGGGVLGWRKRVGYALPGALFEITESGLATLDLKEGTPEVYRWKITGVLLPDGSSARAVVYNLPSTRPSVPVPPALGYLGIVVAGLKGYGHSVIRLLAAAQGTDDAQNVPLFCSGTLMLGAALHGVICLPHE